MDYTLMIKGLFTGIFLYSMGVKDVTNPKHWTTVISFSIIVAL